MGDFAKSVTDDVVIKWRQPVFWRIFLIVYITALAMSALDIANGHLLTGDIDDRMRAIQIRQLLSPTGHWWSLVLPVVSMPEPYVSPWSRLVDLPYVAISIALSPMLGHNDAISWSFLIWPPLMLGIYSILVSQILRRLTEFHTTADYLLLVATTISMTLAVGEFAPGRIDHHGMQILALMTIVLGLVRWDRFGGILIGLGSVTSVAIALEGLPLVVTAFSGLVISYLCRTRASQQVLAGASASVLLCTVPVALVLLGPSASISTQCDAFSAPYIFLLVGCSAPLLLVTTVFPRITGWGQLAIICVVGAAAVVFAALLFPRCLAGPYEVIDPISRSLWFDRILQEKPLWSAAAHTPPAVIWWVGLAGSLLLAAVPPMLGPRGREQPGRPVIFAIAAASLFLTIGIARYVRFPFAFIPLFLPVAYHYLKQGQATPVAWWHTRSIFLASLLLPIAAAQSASMFMPPIELNYDAADYMAFDDCPHGDFSVLGKVTPGRIMAPQGLSLRLAEGMPDGFSVGAIPFHRASPGIRRALEFFILPGAHVRQQALESFDYVAICRFPLKPMPGDAPVYTALAGGEEWPGLVRIPGDASNPFQLFRINYPAVQ
ncbi:hypothetical protein [Neorhizobium sp. T25_13]|uniref:hypothetical protein n=1 Tax=Neorhizobium sp. T25_13 TaxID=2093830 RepID=UPI000CFA378B|nr:hypothetical protein [Neorhizobium sp. T25_13]